MNYHQRARHRKELGRRLVAFREAKGWSRDQAAARFDVAPRTVAYWETGDREPMSSSLLSIAEAFNVSADDLLGR